jgi:sensor histidine kinase YesM
MDNILTLETKNAKSDHFLKKDTHSGIGLKNARERLQLIYPGKHKLEINDSGSSFHVKLQIEID